MPTGHYSLSNCKLGINFQGSGRVQKQTKNHYDNISAKRGHLKLRQNHLTKTIVQKTEPDSQQENKMGVRRSHLSQNKVSSVLKQRLS